MKYTGSRNKVDMAKVLTHSANTMQHSVHLVYIFNTLLCFGLHWLLTEVFSYLAASQVAYVVLSEFFWDCCLSLWAIPIHVVI